MSQKKTPLDRFSLSFDGLPAIFLIGARAHPLLWTMQWQATVTEIAMAEQTTPTVSMRLPTNVRRRIPRRSPTGSEEVLLFMTLNSDDATSREVPHSKTEIPETMSALAQAEHEGSATARSCTCPTRTGQDRAEQLQRWTRHP